MTVLFHALVWNAVEATLLAVAVAIVLRQFRLSAPVRHALWFLVLLRLLMPPVAIHSFGLGACCVRLLEPVQSYAVQHASSLSISNSDSRVGLGELNEPSPAAVRWVADRLEEDGERPVEMTEEVVSQSVDSLSPPQTEEVTIAANVLADSGSIVQSPNVDEVGPARRLATAWRAIGSCLGLLGAEQTLFLSWLLGSLSLLAIRCKQCHSMFRLVAKAESASPSITAFCQEIARALGIKRPPDIKVVQRSFSPTLCALGRSTIVLPSKLLDECDSDVVRTVLAHELAHLKRRDHWVCWIEFMGGLMYWWHPVFWWVQRQMRRAADEAADACAVTIVGDRGRYAKSLLQTVEVLVADRTVAVVWGPALGERNTISRRLTMIMKGPLCHRLSWPAWLGIAVIGLLVLPAAPRSLVAQDTKGPPDESAVTPTGAEFDAAANLLEQDGPGGEPQGGRRPQEPPRSPVPARGPERPVPPEPPARGERGEGRDRRDPEHRLSELEQKVDQILQMLQAMQGGRAGGAGGGMMQGGRPGGAPGMPGAMGGMMVPPGFPGGGGAGPGGNAPGGRAGFGGNVGGGGPQQPGTLPPAAGAGFGGRAGTAGAMGRSGGLFGRSPVDPSGATTPGGAEAQARGRTDDSRQRGALDFMRGLDLTPEQRERVEVMHRELQAEMQKIEAEQARIMAEIQRRRMELERKQADIMREILTPEQRERLEGGRQDRDRGREAPERRRPDGERLREGGGEQREGGDAPRRPDRPRDGGAERP